MEVMVAEMTMEMMVAVVDGNGDNGCKRVDLMNGATSLAKGVSSPLDVEAGGIGF
jgi:hypothetical protein